jgi:hypothetical protein
MRDAHAALICRMDTQDLRQKLGILVHAAGVDTPSYASWLWQMNFAGK